MLAPGSVRLRIGSAARAAGLRADALRTGLRASLRDETAFGFRNCSMRVDVFSSILYTTRSAAIKSAYI